jgi:ABC-type branched-subunit amino acid transport system permease subunit
MSSNVKKRLTILTSGVILGGIITYFLSQWINSMSQDKISLYTMDTSLIIPGTIAMVVMLSALVIAGYYIERIISK